MQQNAHLHVVKKGVLQTPEVQPSRKAIRRLPSEIQPHFVRESARTMRILAGNLEVSVVSQGDVEAAATYFRALILEMERMRMLLNIKL